MKYPFSINDLLSSKIKSNDLSDKHLKSALNFSKFHKIEQFFNSQSQMSSDKREWVRERAQISFNIALAKDLEQRSEAKYLENILSQRKINFIFLKGIALKKTIYKETPHLRECRDIDILIEPKNISEAISALINEGYRFLVLKNQRTIKINYQDGHQIPVLISPRGIYVEVHYRITNILQDCVLSEQMFKNCNGNLAINELNYLNICTHAYKNYFNVGLNCIVDLEHFYNSVDLKLLERNASLTGLEDDVLYLSSLANLNGGRGVVKAIRSSKLQSANKLLYAGEKIIPFNFSFKNTKTSFKKFGDKYNLQKEGLFERFKSLLSLSKYISIKIFLHLKSRLLFGKLWSERKKFESNFD